MDNYNFLAEKYHEVVGIPNGTWDISYGKVLDFLKEKNKVKVLDLGCGTGHFTRDLGKLKESEVVGVDKAEKMLRIAEKYYSASNIQYQISNKSFWGQYKSYFDCVVSTFFFCVFPTTVEISNEFSKVFDCLKPFGEFIFLLPNWEKGNGINFSFVDYHYKAQLEEGDAIEVLLKGERKNLLLNDFFWSASTYIRLLEQCGFKLEIYQNIYANKEEKSLVEEKYFSPFFLIKAKKIIVPSSLGNKKGGK
ncbi:class I SAM-dependent methyltransferase [Xanthovirga aplysinae]|uniref:class I SAM-dependent methyltransferase n=1 Tax=Xanthovirga aplysinae TaxID=2529853 RepID=UPI0012BC20C2|nr:class I SAM-dependent methyltransferase [Xanthovirga aplysinae]MTI33046.1 class I SAM-dependent methyltransferase [Xanthovirga aplysinae]